MVFGLATKKDIKKIENNLTNSFEKRDQELKAELKKDFKLLHNQLHAATAQSTAAAVLNKTEKRVLKKFDTAKLHQAIQSELNLKHSTSLIRDSIMNRFNLGERCFYNHLQTVRELLHNQLHSVTAQSTASKLNGGLE